MVIVSIFSFLNLFFSAHGDPPLSAFEASLQRDTSVLSEESWVQIQGVKYRKFEWDGAHFYVKFNDQKSKTAQLYCVPPPGADKEQLIEEQPQTVRRTRAFVKAFNEKCSNVQVFKAMTLNLDPAIGLVYPERKTESSRQ